MYKYYCNVKTPEGEKPLKYNVKGREAKYNFMGVTKLITVNPLTAYDDIITDIADNLFSYFPNERY